VAALALVGGAVGNRVGIDVMLVAAAMNMQSCGHSNAAAKEEDGIEDIEDQRNQWVECERVLDGRRDEVEQRKHRKGRDEHAVIDDVGIAGICGRDHVADEGHDEKGPDELEHPRDEVNDVRDHDDGVVRRDVVVMSELGRCEVLGLWSLSLSCLGQSQQIYSWRG